MRILWFIVFCLVVTNVVIFMRHGELKLPFTETAPEELVLEESSPLDTTTPPDELTSSSPTPKQVGGAPVPPSTSPQERGTDVAISAAKIEAKLIELDADIELMKVHEPRSPYAGTVVLTNGSAGAQDPGSEYLTLTAPGANSAPVSITGWTLESYVTNRTAVIPEGGAVLVSALDREKGPITLRPGEKAYVVTGPTPLRISFRENSCTGYLSTEGTFSPRLTSSCPIPSDELLQYGSVKSSDTKCHEYIRRIGTCSAVDDSAVEAAELSGSCEMFILNVLTYDGCVERHRADTEFGTVGAWRIFFNRNTELWRSTKETIRLLDGEGKVVSVLEY